MPDAVAANAFRPPHELRRDLLPAALADELLAYAIANQPRFVTSQANSAEGPAVDESYRISLTLDDLGPFKEALKDHVLPLVPALTAALGLEPFAVARSELSLVAHGDGAFLARHIDFLRNPAPQMRTRRTLSGVYYFHARPKAFTGGCLRLYAPMSRGTRFVDIEAAHNTMLFFPSFIAHEVMPVAVPSRDFAASRFAINYWLHAPL